MSEEEFSPFELQSVEQHFASEYGANCQTARLCRAVRRLQERVVELERQNALLDALAERTIQAEADRSEIHRLYQRGIDERIQLKRERDECERLELKAQAEQETARRRTAGAKLGWEIRRAKAEQKLKDQRRCEQCGALFTAENARHRFCTPRCRDYAASATRRAKAEQKLKEESPSP